MIEVKELLTAEQRDTQRRSLWSVTNGSNRAAVIVHLHDEYSRNILCGGAWYAVSLVDAGGPFEPKYTTGAWVMQRDFGAAIEAARRVLAKRRGR